MDFDIHKLKKLNFKKSIIEYIDGGQPDNRGFYIKGSFAEDCGYPYFFFSFHLFRDEFIAPENIEGAEILSLEISELEPKQKYSIKLKYLLGGDRAVIDFLCKEIFFSRLENLGMSYKNMYDEWIKEIEIDAYIESKEYFVGEETYGLEDDFSLHAKYYYDGDDHRTRARLAVYELTGAELKYNFRSNSYSNPSTFFDFIHHSNGHRYFPFHICLYGISYFDLDTREVFHYIPEGYERYEDHYYLSESFIIVGIHYDKNTDLVAYEGCYWGGPYYVMVGDLSDPLNFDPHLVDIYDIVDPDHECEDISFVRFDNGNLIVKDDETGIEKSVSCELLLKMIKEMSAE